MSYLEELFPKFRKGAKIMRTSEAKILGKQPYYFFKDKTIWYNDGISDKDYGSRPFTTNELVADDWEIVQEEPIDWDYIIKNKCLCWFWDDREENKEAKFLIKVWKGCHYCFEFFKDDCHEYFRNCRPVRRDEVTFYENKKNE